MLSSYEVVGNKIHVKTGYSEDVVATCRKWGGAFDKTAGVWIVAATRLLEIQEHLGKDLTDQVEIEVGMDQIEGYAQIRHGWYVLASRMGRDSRANIYADLVAGEIPSFGGSMKNPKVGPSSDARFRLWVARDFAVANNSDIVTDPLTNTPTTETPKPGEMVELSTFSDDAILAEYNRRGLGQASETASRIEQLATMD